MVFGTLMNGISVLTVRPQKNPSPLLPCEHAVRRLPSAHWKRSLTRT